MLHRILVSYLLAALLVSSAHAASIRVLVDGSGDYPTIQDGINALAQGDTLLVGPGTYTWRNQNTDQWPDTFRGMIQLLNESAAGQGDPRAGTANDILILGEAGRAQTFFDAERNGRVLYASGRQAGDDNVAMRFTVQGITFQNGFAQGPIETNSWGGGVATHLSSPTFIDCRFQDNEGETAAGGAWTGGQNKALFENCVFRNNTAPYGAAVLVINTTRHDSVWRNCRFESNVATQIGGGIYTVNARVEIEGCIFIANEAGFQASAIATNVARPLIIRDCFIVGNDVGRVEASTVWARYQVSPDYEGDPLPGASLVEITNTLLASNSGKGIQFDEDVDATVQCTNVYGHSGGNWMNFAAGMRTVNGNGTFDPHLCGTNLRLREVCDLSPVLGANNFECMGDMGLSVAGCSGCEITDYDPRISHTQSFPSYPNPFSESTKLEYNLRRRTHVRITIYDLRGRVVRTLVDRVETPGIREAEWDGSDAGGRTVASGVYYCEFETSDQHSRTPMLVLR